MLKYPLIFGIKIYQKFISPKKGYRCAYSVVHGGSGCSGAVIEILKNHSIFKWRKLIKKRFSDCKIASEEKKKKEGKCSRCLDKITPSRCDLGDACDVCDGCDSCDIF